MARSFTGTDRIVVNDYAAAHDLTTLTLAVWLYKTSSTGLTDRILDKFNAGANGGYYWATQGAGNALSFQYGRWNSSQGNWTTPEPALNQWVPALLTYDASSTANDPAVWYGNVSQTVTELQAPAGSLISETDPLWIGNRTDFARPWPGRLAELAVWNRVLSAGERTALALGYAPSCFRRGLVVYLPLVGRSSPEPNLATGGGNTGAVTGTSAIEHPRLLRPESSARVTRHVPGGGGGQHAGSLVSGSRLKSLVGGALAA